MKRAMTTDETKSCETCGTEMLDFTGLLDVKRRLRCPRQCSLIQPEVVQLLDQKPLAQPEAQTFLI